MPAKPQRGAAKSRADRSLAHELLSALPNAAVLLCTAVCCAHVSSFDIADKCVSSLMPWLEKWQSDVTFLRTLKAVLEEVRALRQNSL